MWLLAIRASVVIAWIGSPSLSRRPPFRLCAHCELHLHRVGVDVSFPKPLDPRLIGFLMVRLGLRGFNRVSCGKYVNATVRVRVEATAMSRSDGHWRLTVLEDTRPLNCGQMCNNRRLRSRRGLESSAVRKGPLSNGLTRVWYS